LVSGTEAMTQNPIYHGVVRSDMNLTCTSTMLVQQARIRLTISPVQNIGHVLHGGSRASCSQALRYGVRTMRGRIGGVSDDASMALARSATAVRAIEGRDIYMVSIAWSVGFEGRRKLYTASSSQ
jgi:hypothetical protein